MFEKLYIHFAETFIKWNEQTPGYGYHLVRFTVHRKLLSELYEKFIKEGIEPIENISIDKKRKYFSISKPFFETTPEIIAASKAAYVLDLMTSND